MQIRSRSRRLILLVLLLCCTGWLAVYAWDKGFTRKWRQTITKELAKHGLRAEIGRLTIDPVEGLTARDVRLFDLLQKDRHLADINQVSLDIDVARLMNREDFLRTVTLHRADMTLPVDPSDESSGTLEVRGLNARLVFQDDRIDIARAEGVVSGLHVKVRGRVRKAVVPPPDAGEEIREARIERDRELEEMRERRNALRGVLRALDRFHVPEGAPSPWKAEVDLEVNGDLSDLDRMEVRVQLRAGALECGDFHLARAEADATLVRGELVLRSLTLEDKGERERTGKLTASGSWRIRQSNEVKLALDSTVNLHALLLGVLEDAPWLHEVVFYSPPTVRMEGSWFAGQPFSWDAPPLDIIGRVSSARLLSRGSVFDSAEADFAITPQGRWHVRNAVFADRSGSVRAQMLRSRERVQYDLLWRMNPEAMLPFLPEDWRKALAVLQYDNGTRVALNFRGGRDGEGEPWHHAGTADLRSFRAHDFPVWHASATVDVPGDRDSAVVRFTDVLVERPDGKAEAAAVTLDRDGMLRIDGGISEAPVVGMAGVFHPPLAQALERYQFAEAPRVELQGDIALRPPAVTDLKMTLSSRGQCGMDLGGRDWQFSGVGGTLHIQGPVLLASLSGNTVAGTTAAGVLDLQDACPMTFGGSFSLIPGSTLPPRYQIRLTAAESAKLKVAGRLFPVTGFHGMLEGEEGGLAVRAEGHLYGGRVTAALDFPDNNRPAHSGAVVLDHVSFDGLSAALGQKQSTGGHLTGRFTYETGDDPATSLKGSGNAGLREGNVFAIPLLGPLSALTSAILPGKDAAYRIAREARAAFTVEGTLISLTDFSAETSGFRLTASGTADTAADSVDLSARLNLKGAPGLLFLPVSKLLEYRANGTLTEPEWRPRILPGGSRPKDKQNKSGKDKPEKR